MKLKLLAAVIMSVLVLCACLADPGEIPDDTAQTTGAPETTTVPPETEKPQTTAPETTKKAETTAKQPETTAPKKEEKTVKEYTVKTLDKLPEDWSSIEKALMDETPWVKDYVPVTYGQVVFVKNDGFYIRMTCEEKEPKATYTKWMDPVYKDSCMEFFACFDANSKAYINVEVNSLGTALSQCGVKGKRTTVSETLGYPLVVAAEVKDSEWSILIHLTLEEIEKLFGVKPEIFVSGYAFRANLYKCGDSTAVPHYNMWNRVDTKKPSYHEPDYFGKMILG